MISFGVVGIFGPQEKITADYIQSVCEAMEVPYISVRQDSASHTSYPRGLGLNLYPHVSSLSRVSKSKASNTSNKILFLLRAKTKIVNQL